jgi:TPR repeat protein
MDINKIMEKYEGYDFSSDSDEPAFREILNKALGGDPFAQSELVGAYKFGKGAVKKDTDKAEYWLRKANENSPKYPPLTDPRELL